MKRYLVGKIVGALLLVLMAAWPVMAQGDVKVVVHNHLSLRAAPTVNAERLTTIPYETELSATAISPDRAWLAVTYQGQPGWVAVQYTGLVSGDPRQLPTSEQTFLRSGEAVASNVVVSPVTNLNFRTEPDLDLEPAGIISYRAEVPALALSQDGRFVLVHYNGHDVWVYRDYLAEVFGTLAQLAPGAPPVPVTLPVDANAEVMAGLPGICTGVGVPAAAPYTVGPGVHPVLLVAPDGERHEWQDYAAGWAPGQAGQVQLVACVSPRQQRELIERCRYDGPDIYRYQYHRDVQLYAAHSGELVAETTLYGTLPRACEAEEPYWLTRLYSDDVYFEQLQAWLQPYVAP